MPSAFVPASGNRVASPSAPTLHPGGLTIASHASDRLIVVIGQGLWTVEQMSVHLDEYRALVARRRRSGVQVEVLVLLEHAGVQSAAVTDALTRGLQSCHRPGDRVAMVVPSALARVQMRRVLSTDFHEYFASEASARAWLDQAR